MKRHRDDSSRKTEGEKKRSKETESPWETAHREPVEQRQRFCSTERRRGAHCAGMGLSLMDIR